MFVILNEIMCNIYSYIIIGTVDWKIKQDIFTNSVGKERILNTFNTILKDNFDFIFQQYFHFNFEQYLNLPDFKCYLSFQF